MFKNIAWFCTNSYNCVKAFKENNLENSSCIINALRAGVQYIRTSISAKQQQFSVALPTP